ncbi:hypothetical protein [Streptomyces sp. SID12501]|uniref:DUF1579 domain-containing protein n=1 Tax=Streptomyces sp. SID12501 TaxID=2706042 RepID=A0A6B3C5G3_9ACTN|nr:hypothetical protein [Streptomyces sp. SID12501]NEC91562.1 hypothetical protein [Streptomyces sp. SID12501]
MSSPHDFDFLHGGWTVRNRRRTDFLDLAGSWEEFDGTSRCWSLFDGAANIEEIDMPPLGSKGLTLRLFDRETEEWSLNWSASGSGRLFPPVKGGFTDQQGAFQGEFYGDDTCDGKDVRVRFVWSEISDSTARWEQAFSADDGATWMTNWTMAFTRVAFPQKDGSSG